MRMQDAMRSRQTHSIETYNVFDMLVNMEAGLGGQGGHASSRARDEGHGAGMERIAVGAQQ